MAVPVLQVVVELLLALPVRAGVPRVPRIILDQLLDLLEGGLEGDCFALVQHLAEVVLLPGDEEVDVFVEEPLALRLLQIVGH